MGKNEGKKVSDVLHQIAIREKIICYAIVMYVQVDDDIDLRETNLAQCAVVTHIRSHEDWGLAIDHLVDISGRANDKHVIASYV